MIVEESFPAIGMDDIKQIEDRFGFTFPSDLKEFYLEHNGGFPERNSFLKNGEPYSINSLLAIKYGGDDLGLEEAMASMADIPQCPKSAIPFAVDGAGDYFFYSFDKRNYGSILFFESERYLEPGGGVVILSENLNKFLDSLVMLED